MITSRFQQILDELMSAKKTDQPENKAIMGFNQSLEYLKAELFRLELDKA